MTDRTAEFETAIRAQAGLISEAQELLTRYLAKEIEAPALIDSLLKLLDGPEQRTGLRGKRWARKNRATSLDLRQKGCIFATFSRCELQPAMANYRRTISCVFALVALVCIGGCSATPPFETAYSAIGTQVK